VGVPRRAQRGLRPLGCGRFGTSGSCLKKYYQLLKMIHLHPYGIFLDLDPTTEKRPIPEDVRVSRVEVVGETYVMFDETNAKALEFRMREQLGKGSFSDVFASDLRIDNMETVVKRISISEYSINEVLTEALTHILVFKATEHYREGGLKGPFAPHFFRIGADKDFCYIVNERMHLTLKQVVETVDKPSILMHLFVEVATIMKILWDKIGFNHRDMKFDNIMFDKEGKIRIIDFGFSCLNYGVLQIVPAYSHSRKTLEHCDLRSRDMKTFFHYFINITKFRTFNCPLHRIIKALMFSGGEEPTNWLAVYPVYNAEPNLPNMFPETIINVFKHLRFMEPENMCSEIDPSWVNHIGELNKGLLKTLTKEELNHIQKGVLLDYLTTYPSARLLGKIMRTTDDEEIRLFCEKGLANQNLILNTPTRKGGGKKNKIKKLRRSRKKGN